MASKREAAAAQVDVGAGPALDLLTDLLRLLGETAIDLDQMTARMVHERYEEWARHLLIGTPPPGAGGALIGEPIPLAERDFAGARRWAVQHRGRETQYLLGSLAELRETIWSFIHILGTEVGEDRAADESLREQMTRVRRAVETSSIDEIRREAIAAVGAMGRAIAERRRQQREQFQALGEHVRNLREELESARAKMERDAATGVYNRAALDEHLQRMSDLGTLFGEPVCLLVLDVDHFKWANDRFGHATGDQILRGVAGSLSRTLVRKEDFVARYGGDEFVAVVNVAASADAEIVGEKLLSAVRDMSVRSGGESVRVTVSIGAARYRPGEDPQAWFERADTALYAAKEAGRDCVRLAPEES